ncbi:chaperonin 10-like protein [Gymnopilus junonius]|uniref:Chaperonin 10-like protein n=1 Tax=Gymnopilus junonius TaxID=109634 RepID=A0A9P5NZU2_GYMJU|nr:chaperonin 10-like protein [Gymnopilus junonius]
MTTTQKALVLNEKFGQFNIQEIEVYRPGPREILIKYDFEIDAYPAILGCDIAGDVEAIGEGVSDFKLGDRVFSSSVILKDRGAFQQYVLVSTLPVALSTGYSGLYAKLPHGLEIDLPDSRASLGKYTGTPILILGGASSLAKYSGFSYIITTASLKHADSLKEFGATHVLDRNLTSAELNKEIIKITDKPIELIYDTISIDSTQSVAFDVLALGGKVTFVLPPVIESTDWHIAHIHAGLRQPHNIPLLHDLYHDKAYELLVKGVIKPNRFEVLPNGLAGIVDGLARLEADQVSRLKLVVHPQETP